MTNEQIGAVAAQLSERSTPEALTGCFLWEGNVDRKGYGRIRLYGAGTKKPPTVDIKAHRAAYEIAYGPVPDGLLVLHSCDVPAYVNPEHLRAGTAAQNTADALGRRRLSRGEKHPGARLTWELVRRIRTDGGTCRAVGAALGISYGLVSRIRRGEIWRTQ